MTDRRIKITGYYTPDDHERDDDDATGLTAEAFEARLMDDGTGTVLTVADLEDVEAEVE